jgi:endonuclease-3
MSATQRAERIEKLFKVLRKHYKPPTPPTHHSLLEQLLYASCLEDSKFDSADEAYAKLEQTKVDWNETRVTTVAELAELLRAVRRPPEAARRVRGALQAIFESRYAFELEDLKKSGLNKVSDEFRKWGLSRFVIDYVVLYGLSGHAIPLDSSALDLLCQMELFTPQEIEKKSPGLERIIPKAKGSESFALLHQFAVDFSSHPRSAVVQAVFKELGVSPKPKQEKPKAQPEKPASASTATKGPQTSAMPAISSGAKTAGKPSAAKQPAAKQPAAKKAAPQPPKKVAPASPAAAAPQPPKKAPKIATPSKAEPAKPAASDKAPKKKGTSAPSGTSKSGNKKPVTPPPAPPRSKMVSKKPSDGKASGKSSAPKSDSKKITKKKPK